MLSSLPLCSCQRHCVVQTPWKWKLNFEVFSPVEKVDLVCLCDCGRVWRLKEDWVKFMFEISQSISTSGAGNNYKIKTIELETCVRICCYAPYFFFLFENQKTYPKPWVRILALPRFFTFSHLTISKSSHSSPHLIIPNRKPLTRPSLELHFRFLPRSSMKSWAKRRLTRPLD